MRQTQLIAEQFLAVNISREDAKQRLERFVERLERSGVWRPDELVELREIIEAGLQRRGPAVF